MVDITGACFSSNSDEWSTPQNLFGWLNEQYHFTLDPCASADNHKCDKYFTIKDDGLEQSWEGETVFINPPYSDIKRWVKKVYDETQKPITTAWLLVPARTDTSYFHDYVMKSNFVYLIRGRLKFGNSKNCAPFPSMLVYFTDYHGRGSTEFRTLDKKCFEK